MLPLPEEPTGGEFIRSSWGKKVVRYLRMITVHSSADISVQTTGNATTLVINKSPSSRASASSSLNPFDIILTLVSGTTYNLLLFPGAVNQFVPDNILTPISYDSTTTRYIKLRITTDGKKVTGCTIVSEAGATTGIDTTANAGPTTFDILIGVIILGSIKQVRDGNLRATLLNMLTQSVAVPVPGTSPYVYYYTWTIVADV